jgi:hypothetical protein
MTEQQSAYNIVPLTPGQWLLRSLYWVGGCQAGIWLLTKTMTVLKDYLSMLPSSVLELVALLMWGSCSACIFLIWQNVLAGSSAVLLHDARRGTFSWARLLMLAWRAVLAFGLVFHLCIILLMSGALLMDICCHEPIGDYF